MFSQKTGAFARGTHNEADGGKHRAPCPAPQIPRHRRHAPRPYRPSGSGAQHHIDAHSPLRRGHPAGKQSPGGAYGKQHVGQHARQAGFVSQRARKVIDEPQKSPEQEKQPRLPQLIDRRKLHQ